MTRIEEVAPDLYRISTYLSRPNIQFNQFFVRDEQPLLFHTGLKLLFPAVSAAVARLMPPSKIKWIGMSHFEADECGSLREWQALAPEATGFCSVVAKVVSIDDVVAARRTKGLVDDAVLVTGKYRFRCLRTPHVPHCWDAALLFEETNATFLCSDLFHQNGDVEPMTASDVVGRFRQALIDYQKSPLADYLPYTTLTEPTLHRLAKLKPKTCATMHGSTFVGDGERAITELAAVMKEFLRAEATIRTGRVSQPSTGYKIRMPAGDWRDSGPVLRVLSSGERKFSTNLPLTRLLITSGVNHVRPSACPVRSKPSWRSRDIARA